MIFELESIRRGGEREQGESPPSLTHSITLKTAFDTELLGGYLSWQWDRSEVFVKPGISTETDNNEQRLPLPPPPPTFITIV